MLMLAAGLGQVDYLRALIDGGANRTRLTIRNKMSALDIAAETGHWRSAQILLGGGLRRTSCASKFLSLCNGWLWSRTAYRYTAPTVRPVGKVTRRRPVNL